MALNQLSLSLQFARDAEATAHRAILPRHQHGEKDQQRSDIGIDHRVRHGAGGGRNACRKLCRVAMKVA